MKKIIIKRDNRYSRRQIKLDNDTIVEQHHKKIVDINNIVSKYKKTGIIDKQRKDGFYGDFTNAVDYDTALNKLRDADKDFSLLPSQLREKFENNPSKLIDFIANSDNYDEAIALGLIEKVDEPQPVVVTIANAIDSNASVNNDNKDSDAS